MGLVLAGGAVALATQAPKIGGHTFRAIGSGLDFSRHISSGFKNSLKSRIEATKGTLNNMFSTTKAVSEGSVDISNLIGGLPYKVRMLPSSIGGSTKLSYKADALYLPEQIFNQEYFSKTLQISAKEQGLTLDAKSFSITMDFYGRLQFSYPGKFDGIFLDQFGIGTPTHTALTNAIRGLIDMENKKISTQIVLGHHLKDIISKNNRNVKCEYSGTEYSMSLQEAADLLISGQEGEKNFLALSSLLTQNGVDVKQLKNVIDTKNLIAKDVVAQYPEGRKVMDKSYYMRSNNYYTFDPVKAEDPKKTNVSAKNEAQVTVSPIIPTATNLNPSSASNFVTTPTQDIQVLYNSFVGDITKLTTLPEVTSKFDFVKSVTSNPTFVSTQPALWLKMMEAQSALQVKKDAMEAQAKVNSVQQTETAINQVINSSSTNPADSVPVAANSPTPVLSNLFTSNANVSYNNIATANV